MSRLLVLAPDHGESWDEAGKNSAREPLGRLGEEFESERGLVP